VINRKRPKNLNLFSIHFPLPAIVSILHRLSGIALFILFPLGLWALSFSLSSEDNFNSLQQNLSSFTFRMALWIFLAPLTYHLVAGIRHLMMDLSIGDGLQSGRIGSIITLLVSAVLMVLLGVWLW